MNTDEPEDVKIERVVIAHMTAHEQAGGEDIGIHEVSGPLSRMTNDQLRSATT